MNARTRLFASLVALVAGVAAVTLVIQLLHVTVG
jgi:hypothetical protein